MNKEYTLEPIDFLFSEQFFKGVDEQNLSDFLLVKRREDAFLFAFEQNLPSGYKIWQDVLSEYEKKLRANSLFSSAQSFVSAELENRQKQNSSLLLEYRKKKIKNINSEYDDFLFSEARQDAFSVLALVCINRYLDNEIKDDFFERVYGLYKSGGWVCGMKKERFLLFNPNLTI
ncbi:hypothetical protein AB8W28_15120 [Cronobacter universalis]|uniref:Uncharacterized protein n=1 Tax=Cronobacter universalis NCTC 9529 TaxID=1074000 RepID=A0AAC9EVK1_9ENTR|nr:hypothetical protein [Cronobacter universalis]ALB53213.1 hypothetical protein AFK65_00380 [Cronobacter universalis NCTC 9529]STC96847.1 Uncharacterised protein [Cronobacter universalis NCTC 9529]